MHRFSNTWVFAESVEKRALGSNSKYHHTRPLRGADAGGRIRLQHGQPAWFQRHTIDNDDIVNAVTCVITPGGQWLIVQMQWRSYWASGN
jgi:hypothetical protein